METTTIKEPWLTFLGGLSVIIISRVTPRGTGRSSAVFSKKLFPAGEDLVWQTHKSGHKIRRRSLQSFACNVPLRWFAFDRVKIQPAPRGLPADYAAPCLLKSSLSFSHATPRKYFQTTSTGLRRPPMAQYLPLRIPGLSFSFSIRQYSFHFLEQKRESFMVLGLLFLP